jgi:hypothetical protein
MSLYIECFKQAISGPCFNYICYLRSDEWQIPKHYIRLSFSFLVMEHMKIHIKEAVRIEIESRWDDLTKPMLRHATIDGILNGGDFSVADLIPRTCPKNIEIREITIAT